MSTHKKYNASAAGRWMNCAGSKVGLPESKRERVSVSPSTTGTAAHWLAEQTLLGKIKSPEEGLDRYIAISDDSDAVKLFKKPGKKYPVYIYVDDTMVEGVTMYTGLIQQLIKQRGGELQVEVKTEISDEAGGTADAVIKSDNTLYVVDYKNGFVDVPIKNNAQLLMYATAILNADKDYKPENVTIIIVQPNTQGESIKHQTLSADLVRDMVNKYKTAIERIKELDEQLAAGENIDDAHVSGKWCKYCEKTAICPRLHKDLLDMVDQDFGDFEPVEPESIMDVTSDEHKAWIVKNSSNIKELIDSVKEEMMNKIIASGDDMYGLTVIEGSSKTRVIDKNLFMKELEEKGLLDRCIEPKLLPINLKKFYLKKFIKNTSVDQRAHLLLYLLMATRKNPTNRI